MRSWRSKLWTKRDIPKIQLLTESYRLRELGSFQKQFELSISVMIAKRSKMENFKRATFTSWVKLRCLEMTIYHTLPFPKKFVLVDSFHRFMSCLFDWNDWNYIPKELLTLWINVEDLCRFIKDSKSKASSRCHTHTLILNRRDTIATIRCGNPFLSSETTTSTHEGVPRGRQIFGLYYLVWQKMTSNLDHFRSQIRVSAQIWTHRWA